MEAEINAHGRTEDDKDVLVIDAQSSIDSLWQLSIITGHIPDSESRPSLY